MQFEYKYSNLYITRAAPFETEVHVADNAPNGPPRNPLLLLVVVWSIKRWKLPMSRAENTLPHMEYVGYLLCVVLSSASAGLGEQSFILVLPNTLQSISRAFLLVADQETPSSLIAQAAAIRCFISERVR
jgi:hypothetical protein